MRRKTLGSLCIVHSLLVTDAGCREKFEKG
jgi:hypothetical protein